MGLKEMLKTWLDERKERKKVEHEARIEYIKSPEYKQDIINKEKQKVKQKPKTMKETLHNIFGDIDFDKKISQMSEGFSSDKITEKVNGENNKRRESEQERLSRFIR